MSFLFHFLFFYFFLSFFNMFFSLIPLLSFLLLGQLLLCSQYLVMNHNAHIKHSVSFCNEKCDYQPLAGFPVNQTNFWENSVCFPCCPNVFCYTSSHALRWFQSPSSCLSSLGYFVIPMTRIDYCAFKEVHLLCAVDWVHWSRLLLLPMATKAE